MFDAVSFAYPGQDAPSLQGVTFAIRRGSVNVVVGPSGSGKTTVVNLLSRLSEPGGGSITVDGRPLRELSRADWLAWTGFAGPGHGTAGRHDPQQRLARPAGSGAGGGPGGAGPGGRARLRGAAAAPACRPWSATGGLRLSGGQRQRIALARALARHPTLLVLDEAANAVEPGMETAILDGIRAARPDLTLVIVTHRGEVAGADQVMTVEDGRVRVSARGALVA